jgi:hypothetical protein
MLMASSRGGSTSRLLDAAVAALSSPTPDRGLEDRYVAALLGTLLADGRTCGRVTCVKGDDMPEHTITELLAGTIDLARIAAPPHRPGPCTALCVPACAGRPDAGPTGTAPQRHDTNRRTSAKRT